MWKSTLIYDQIALLTTWANFLNKENALGRWQEGKDMDQLFWLVNVGPHKKGIFGSPLPSPLTI